MNRVVLVSGSSRGIGLGIARAFLQEGDFIILNGRVDNKQLENTLSELKNEFSPEKIMGKCVDLCNYNACVNFINEIENSFGEVDILVNNAGVSYYGLFHKMKPAELEENINANLRPSFNFSHLVVSKMVKKKSGNIINISSIWGVSGASCEVVYSAAKAAINGFSKALAKELAPSNIRVNAIACGAIETRMNEHLTEDEKNAFAEEIPLGRFGYPYEVGDLAVFLASNKSGYITGQVVLLDGGL